MGRQPDGREGPSGRAQPAEQAGLLAARLSRLGLPAAVVPGGRLPGQPAGKFTQMWGYIYRQSIAPVYVGEFGTKLGDPRTRRGIAQLGGDYMNDAHPAPPARRA